MGIPLGGAVDQANIAVVGQLETVGAVTAWTFIDGTFNLAVWVTGGATGSVEIEHSFDGGATVLRASNLGVVPSFPAGVSETIFSREQGKLTRVKRISGTGTGFFVRLSQ